MNKEIHNLLKIENDKTTIFTNKELKMIDDYINELEAYKYNMDRDYLRLEKENKILRENAEHNDKVVDKVNWENKELKKQLETINEQANYLRKSVERKEETIIDLQNERVPYTNEYVAKLENQQKEFIEYMENEINKWHYNYDSYTYEYELEEPTAEELLQTVLSKYKEIIGSDKK